MTFSAVVLTLQPIDYYNGDHKDYNGDCCDDWLWCLSQCENWFKFCITSFPVSDFGRCIIYARTRVLGDDNFYFPAYGHSIGVNLYTPLRMRSVDRWPVSD